MKNKKCLLIVLIIISSVFFSSCSLFEEETYAFFDTDREFTDKTFAKLIDAINNKDEEKLKNLFSVNTQNSVKDFEDNVNYLMNFFKEQTLEFEKTDGVGSKAHYENCKKVVELITAYNVKSNVQKYYFAINLIRYDTFDNYNEGVISLYIINAKDWHEEFEYGVQENISGIHIVSDY